MAGQPPLQGPEDDFLDQLFSMAAGGSYSAAAAGAGRAAGDQPFSLALSLDAAAEASESGKRLGGDAEGGKAVSVPPPRNLLSLPLSPSLAFAFAPNELVRVLRVKKTCVSPLQDRDAVQLPGLFPPVFGAGVQPPHLRPNPPPQVLCSLQFRCMNYACFGAEFAGSLLIAPFWWGLGVPRAQTETWRGRGRVGSHPPAPRPKVRARRGQATDPRSISERVRKRSLLFTCVPWSFVRGDSHCLEIGCSLLGQ
jgi:hypothetical protein